MDPKKQQIAVLKACGWEEIIVPIEDELGPIGNLTEIKWKRPSNPKGLVNPTNNLPDLDDLNFMHEAEEWLKNQPDSTYSKTCIEGYDRHLLQSFGPRATAAQRREAFLKVCGLWEP